MKSANSKPLLSPKVACQAMELVGHPLEYPLIQLEKCIGFGDRERNTYVLLFHFVLFCFWCTGTEEE